MEITQSAPIFTTKSRNLFFIFQGGFLFCGSWARYGLSTLEIYVNDAYIDTIIPLN